MPSGSVQSMALQSARKTVSLEAFLKHFAGRLEAMASAHALLTATRWRGAEIGNIAAARGVKLTRVESFVDGDIDLRGILGISDEVRNGYSNISIRFEIEGDAPPEKLQQILDQARARSAVFDVLRNGVPVSVAMNSVQ